MLNYNLLSTKPSVVIVDSKEISNDRLDSMFYHSKYIKNKSNLIENKIEIRDLEDISINMNAPVGWKGIPSSSYLPNGEGVPLIRGKNIKNLLLDLDSLIGVEERIYKEQPEIQAQNNDIILTRVGTIGRVCRVPNNLEKIAMGQNLTRVELDKSIVKSEYVLAYMASKYGQLQMDRYAYGGVQPSLTNKNIKRLQIPIPSHEIQKYIGDKVRRAEKLREEVKELQIKAENILTDYLGEISRDIIENQNYQKFIKEKNLYERLDAKYYHENYDNLIKELENKAHNLKPISKVCSKVFNGRTTKTKYQEDADLYQVTVGSLDNWWPKLEKEKGIIKENIKEKYICRQGDIIWGNSAHKASYIGENVNVIVEDDKFSPSNEITLIRPDSDKILPEFLYLYMNSEWGYHQVQRTVKGSTAHSYPEDVERIMVPIIEFTEEEKEIFRKSVYSGYEKIIKSKKLIEEAKQDVEDLIEGNLKIEH